jgi:hypothetical protein
LYIQATSPLLHSRICHDGFVGFVFIMFAIALYWKQQQQQQNKEKPAHQWASKQK